jgi:hypothetical protein
MLAIVDAEREYAIRVHDDNGIRQYAQKLERFDPDETWTKVK